MKDGTMYTYEQYKLGLSAYYDKRWVLEDGIHTDPIEFHTANWTKGNPSTYAQPCYEEEAVPSLHHEERQRTLVLATITSPTSNQTVLKTPQGFSFFTGRDRSIKKHDQRADCKSTF